MSTRVVLCAALALPLLAAAPAAGAAEPAKVTVGSYFNQILDLSFRERRYIIDFWVWFRWEPVGDLDDYNPLESFELVNGRVDAKTSVVEKKIDKLKYASARVTASISQAWDLNACPFDRHRLQIHLEDSRRAAGELIFEPDLDNSRLGDEIDLSGWTVSGFNALVRTKVYETNFGDVSLPTRDVSVFSRF